MPFPFFVMPPAPAPIIPATVVLPVPPTVKRLAPLVTPFVTVSRDAESFVQVWAAPSVSATFCPVAPPIVTAPAPAFNNRPLAPRVRTRLVPPPCRAVVPVLLNTRPSAAWFAFRATTSAPLTVLMLKNARSAATGEAAGSGVVAAGSVDQFAGVLHPPAARPSQYKLAANVAGERAVLVAMTAMLCVRIRSGRAKARRVWFWGMDGLVSRSQRNRGCSVTRNP